MPLQTKTVRSQAVEKPVSTIPINKTGGTTSSSVKKSLYLPQDLPTDRIFAALYQAGIVDEYFHLRPSFKLPEFNKLGKDSLKRINDFLNTEIDFHFDYIENTGFHFEEKQYSEKMTVRELYQFLNKIYREKEEKDVKGIYLVGGGLPKILGSEYYHELLKLLIDDLESLITIADLKHLDVMPSDFDTRINTENAKEVRPETLATLLVKKLAKTKADEESNPSLFTHWCSLIQGKHGVFASFNPIFLSKIIQGVLDNDGFLLSVFNKVYHKIDILIYKLLNVFKITTVQDGEINLLPLLDVENLENSKVTVIPEGSLADKWLAALHRMTQTVELVGAKGWGNFISGITLGGTCRIPNNAKNALMDLLKKSIIPEDFIELIQHSLQERWDNHHGKNPLTLIALTFNACQFLNKDLTDKDLLDKFLNPTFTVDDVVKIIWGNLSTNSTFIQLNKKLTEPNQNIGLLENILKISAYKNIPFKLTCAYLQAGSYLQLHSGANSNTSSFKCSLTSLEGKPAMQLLIDGHAILLPFEPAKAFETIENSDDEQLEPLIKILIPERGYRMDTSIHRNLDHLGIDIAALEKLSEKLLQNPKKHLWRLGVHLRLANFNLKPSRESVRELVKDLPIILSQETCSNQRKHVLNSVIELLNNMLKEDLSTASAKQLSEEMQPFLHLKTFSSNEAKLAWIKALASVKGILAQEAYLLWKGDGFSNQVLDPLTISYHLLNNLLPGNLTKALQLFNDIQQYSQRDFDQEKVFFNLFCEAFITNRHLKEHPLAIDLFVECTGNLIKTNPHLQDELAEMLVQTQCRLIENDRPNTAAQLISKAVEHGVLQPGKNIAERAFLNCCNSFLNNSQEGIEKAKKMWSKGKSLNIWDSLHFVKEQETLISSLLNNQPPDNTVTNLLKEALFDLIYKKEEPEAADPAMDDTLVEYMNQSKNSQKMFNNNISTTIKLLNNLLNRSNPAKSNKGLILPIKEIFQELLQNETKDNRIQENLHGLKTLCSNPVTHKLLEHNSLLSSCAIALLEKELEVISTIKKNSEGVAQSPFLKGAEPEIYTLDKVWMNILENQLKMLPRDGFNDCDHPLKTNLCKLTVSLIIDHSNQAIPVALKNEIRRILPLLYEFLQEKQDAHTGLKIATNLNKIFDKIEIKNPNLSKAIFWSFTTVLLESTANQPSHDTIPWHDYLQQLPEVVSIPNHQEEIQFYLTAGEILLNKGLYTEIPYVAEKILQLSKNKKTFTINNKLSMLSWIKSILDFDVAYHILDKFKASMIDFKQLALPSIAAIPEITAKHNLHKYANFLTYCEPLPANQHVVNRVKFVIENLLRECELSNNKFQSDNLFLIMNLLETYNCRHLKTLKRIGNHVQKTQNQKLHLRYLQLLENSDKNESFIHVQKLNMREKEDYFTAWMVGLKILIDQTCKKKTLTKEADFLNSLQEAFLERQNNSYYWENSCKTWIFYIYSYFYLLFITLSSLWKVQILLLISLFLNIDFKDRLEYVLAERKRLEPLLQMPWSYQLRTKIDFKLINILLQLPCPEHFITGCIYYYMLVKHDKKRTFTNQDCETLSLIRARIAELNT